MSGHGHAGGREEGQHREEEVASDVGVGALLLAQAQRLQVVGEGERDDGKVGGDGEHRKQGQEDVHQELGPGI